MQFITVLSVAASMAATASARSAVTLNEDCDTSLPMARVHNRCSYDVYLWSVYQGDGCPTDEMVTLKAGETYQENYQQPDNGVGISIKLSKTQECGSDNIAQLEYFIQSNSPGFNYNYLDVSYVNCQSDTADCPTRSEGYYLVAGNQTGDVKANSADTWCPILTCTDAASCDLISYVNPNDVQTKTCEPDANTDFYMCGGDAPGDESSSPSSAVASSAAASSSAAPSSTEQAHSSAAQATSAAASSAASYEADFKVAAAAVTPAPSAEQGNGAKTKTEVVYVTAYQTINAKRHAHAHARRHQPFHA